MTEADALTERSVELVIQSAFDLPLDSMIPSTVELSESPDTNKEGEMVEEGLSPKPTSVPQQEKRPRDEKVVGEGTRKSPRFQERNDELKPRHTRSGASFTSNTSNDSNSNEDDDSNSDDSNSDDSNYDDSNYISNYISNYVVGCIGDEVKFRYNRSKKVKDKDITMTLEQAAKMDMEANRRFHKNKRRLVDRTMEENRAVMDEAIPTEEPLTTLPPNTKKEFKNAKLAFLTDLIEIMESRPQPETTPNGNTTTDPSFSNILLTLTGEIKKDDELLKQWQNNFDELVDKARKEEKVFRMAGLSHIDSGEDEKDTRNAKFDEGECNRKQRFLEPFLKTNTTFAHFTSLNT